MGRWKPDKRLPPGKRTEACFYVPVTESQVLASASLDEHHLGAEEQLLHDVYEQTCVQLRVGEVLGQLAAVLDQLVATGNAVSVQVQDGNAQGGAGGLIRAGEGETVNLGTRAVFKSSCSVETTIPTLKGWKSLREEAGHITAGQKQS